MVSNRDAIEGGGLSIYLVDKLLNNCFSWISEDTKAKQSTTNAGAGECPSSHPFAYWHGGQYCCPTNIDKEGNLITLDSLSCENNAQIKCPHSQCINYEGRF